MKKLIILLAFAVVGCSYPQSTERTSNSQYDYEILFVRKNCEFGKYYDRGRWIHTVICTGSNNNAQTSVRQSCGKHCNREVNNYSGTI